jgi:preprotein translocase subunit SecE
VAEENAAPSGGPISFINETREELKKVVWPTRDEATNLTIVVLFMTLLMTVLLGGMDVIFTQMLDLIIPG